MKSYKKHWLVVMVTCGLAASSIGLCNNAVGVFYTPVSKSLGVLRGTFAMHATLSLISTAVMSLFIPKLISKFPFKKLLLIGVLSSVLSTIAMSFSHNIMLFYILSIIRGLGSGLFAIMPISMIINNWFLEKHGTAMSIALSFSGLSGAICSPLLTYFIYHFSWQVAYLVMALLIGLFTLPALLYPFDIQPEKCGYQPYGQKNNTVIQQQNHFHYLQITFFCLCIFALTYPSITGITQHFPGIASSIGFNETIGATMMSCAMIGNITMKLVIGFLSDHLSPAKSIYIMMVVNISSLTLLYTQNNIYILYFASFIFGSVYSIGAVGIPLMTRYVFGQENYAKTYAIAGFLTSIGSSSSLTLIGYLYDFQSSYMPALLVAVFINILNALMIAFMVKHKDNLA